ncbi:MAG: rhodanese-like domain-containing protein [Planctomycetes bacterium]|nr:rhodanese-like domain-containing protein [Planctomycetota bacterium]
MLAIVPLDVEHDRVPSNGSLAVKYIAYAFVFGAGCLVATLVNSTLAADPKPAPTPVPPNAAIAALANPAIDMNGFLKVSQQAAEHRKTRRVSEADFIRMSAEEGTIVLDARSKDKFDLLHIKGAVHLNFSDISIESLKRMFPDKKARILIYCNNNFKNNEIAFASKMPTASLNLSTYITLYNYGYENVYELAPQLDPTKSKLTFESTTQQIPQGR